MLCVCAVVLCVCGSDVFGDAGSRLFRQHHNDVIDMLLGRGASFLSPDYAGDTPMDLLRRWAQDI